MKNLIPEYKLGTDLHGARNILVKVDDSTTTKNMILMEIWLKTAQTKMKITKILQR